MKKARLIVLVLGIFSTVLLAQEVGTPAPNFTHVTLDHGTLSLADYSGKVVYLFFFGHG